MERKFIPSLMEVLKSEFATNFSLLQCHRYSATSKHALHPTLRLLSEWFYWQPGWQLGRKPEYDSRPAWPPAQALKTCPPAPPPAPPVSRESKLSRTLLGFSCQSLDIVSGQSLCFRFHLETANFPLSITARISHFSDLKNVDRTIRPGPLEDVIGYN